MGALPCGPVPYPGHPDGGPPVCSWTGCVSVSPSVWNVSGVKKERERAYSTMHCIQYKESERERERDEYKEREIIR